MRVLFVCSGNICRSAMAAEYARRKLASSGLSHILVDSAGTLQIEGEPASPAGPERADGRPPREGRASGAAGIRPRRPRPRTRR